MRRHAIMSLAALGVFASLVYAVTVSTTLDDFFLAGSQPGQSGQLETPDRCDNCHGGYDVNVEPAFNWRGGMMSQAARDPFFYACMTVANQDAAFAGDLCIRCHTPSGWIEGRSTPTDGSALNLNDRQGVQCDFCHKLVKPTELGVNPYPTDTRYTSGTYPADQTYLSTISSHIPPTSANGMYIIDSDNGKRGPFHDAVARHQFYYSPFHQDAAICGTCHDVSNPVFKRVIDVNGVSTYEIDDLASPNPSMNPYDMFPAERTFSEWKNSTYATTGVSTTRFGGNKEVVRTCQDCHMQDVTGKGANKKNSPLRTDLPLHDMTGGNTWVPDIISLFYPNEIDQSALAAGKQRAAYMLQNAATLEVEEELPVIEVTVINETGHKLPSGYPEGRRIWLNVQAYNANNALVGEFGHYDYPSATLTKTNTKVYEVKLAMSESVQAATGLSNDPDGSSFHFAVNNMVVKDNRIPPRGFTNAAFEAIQSPPVNYSYDDGDYYDETYFTLPATTAYYKVNLYYQTASKEYVTFLRDENVTNSWGDDLYSAWENSGKSAPVLMATYDSRGTIVDNQAPTVPPNLSAAAPKYNAVNLSWDPSTDNVGVAGYYVYRTDQGTTPIATVATTTYSDGSVVERTSYTYTVKAFDAANNVSGVSNSATITTPAKKGGGSTGGGKGKKNPKISSTMPLLAQHGFMVLVPNPVKSDLTVKYVLREPANVTVTVYNTTGKIIASYPLGARSKGLLFDSFDAAIYPTGIFYVKLDIASSGGTTTTIQKGIVIR